MAESAESYGFQEFHGSREHDGSPESDRAEAAQLLSLLKNHSRDASDDGRSPDRQADRPVRWRITGIESRAAHMTRVHGILDRDDDADADTDADTEAGATEWAERWCIPNVAIRIELPFQSAEFHGIPDAPVTASRVYTVATADPERREITVDFVVHEGDSPAMLWLRSVRPGDVVELSQPRQHRIPLVATSHVLVVDSTGLPAAVSVLTGMDLPGRVRLLARIPSDEVPELDGVEVIRVEEPLDRAFAALDLDGVDSVWGAAESGEMRPVRRHCRRTLGLSKEATQVYGYWRRGASNTRLDLDRLRLYRDILAAGGDPAELEERMVEMVEDE